MGTWVADSTSWIIRANSARSRCAGTSNVSPWNGPGGASGTVRVQPSWVARTAATERVPPSADAPDVVTR